MLRKAIRLFIFCFIWAVPLVGQPQLLKIDDIPKVMERFFAFHIDVKDFNTTVVRRCIKLYIEQFDSEKAYLLSGEVEPYLNMSDERATEILQRLKEHDYSDFFKLNAMMQDAVVRAQALRSFAVKELILSRSLSSTAIPPSNYARDDAGLMQRQMNRMIRFYQFHDARSNLDTADRKAKVYELFEKRSQRAENNYLFLTADHKPMDRSKIENLLASRILKSFARSLDTHSSFFSPEEANEMRTSLEKQFDGVGVVLSEGVDGVMISDLIKGSPAEQSGQIRVNDLLVEIDGIPTIQASFEDVLEMMKKKDKGEITLGFRRQGDSKQSVIRVPLQKRPIVMNEERIRTSYEKVDGGIVGKISLYSFYENSDGVSSEKDIKEAIRSFREKGNLVGLILDLRDNSGGFLSQAVKVAGLFVSNGVIVISKYGQGEVHYLRNIVSRSFYNGPLVVLTSKMSASASEIVAQALQDYGVALIVGDQRTFGKGSIQYQTVTDAKADVFFKVTVGRYYTVSGKSPQLDGVIADIVIPSAYSPYNIGEMYLEYPLPRDRVEAAYVDPLTDLDEKTRRLFELRYSPFQQRAVTYWKKMIPELKKNSAYRMANDPRFQELFKKQKAASGRANNLPPNTIDEQIQVGTGDLQMEEAVNVVKDMIMMESHQESGRGVKTGSD